MKWRNGHVLVLGLALSLIVGWLIYRNFIPDQWLRNFAADIALRGTPDPNAPLPTDSRQVTPRGLADHPYICLRKLVPFSWDRMIVVPSGGDLQRTPGLGGVVWPDDMPEKYRAEMASDRRYQLIVLLKGDRVVGSDLFYTFWGDLSALARPDGFIPETAIFTAVVRNGRYVLTPVEPPFPPVCS